MYSEECFKFLTIDLINAYNENVWLIQVEGGDNFYKNCNSRINNTKFHSMPQTTKADFG